MSKVENRGNKKILSRVKAQKKLKVGEKKSLKSGKMK